MTKAIAPSIWSNNRNFETREVFQISINRTVSLTTLTLLLAASVVFPALRAADIPGDSKEVSDLLSQAKIAAKQLKTDASETVISDFVDYGATKTKFEKLTQRLEFAER